MTSLKRVAALPVEALDVESKSKKPRFWAPGEKEFPPSAVPSLFDIARLEGVRQLDAVPQSETAALLTSMIAQEIAISGQVQFVPEMVALQRFHQSERLGAVYQLGSDALTTLVGDFADEPHVFPGEDTGGSRNDLIAELDQSNAAIEELYGFIAERKTQAEEADKEFDRDIAIETKKEPEDAFAVSDERSDEFDTVSWEAQWTHLTGSTTPPPVYSLLCYSSVRPGGGVSCSEKPWHNAFFCRDHVRETIGPDKFFYVSDSHGVNLLVWRARNDVKTIPAGTVLDVFTGKPFFGNPSGEARVMQVRPGVWLDGAGLCLSAAVVHHSRVPTIKDHPAARSRPPKPNVGFQRRVSLNEVPARELDVSEGRLIVLVALRDIIGCEELIY